MKKLISVVLSALMFAVILLPTAAAQPLSGDTVIVISENAEDTEKYAAETLKKGIEEVTDKTVNIITDKEETDAFRILVGATALTENKNDGLTNGSYVIKSGENRIEINGAGNSGTLRGVYRFLDEYAGFKCYSEAIGFKSYTGKLELPENADISYTPYFEYTDTDWISPRNDIYSLANGLNGGVYRTLTPEQGGTVNYIGPFCHTFATFFCAAEKYFDEHPEYFALRDGKRTPEQLCLTNEDVYKIVLEEVFALLKEKHDKNADLQIISLTQNDSDSKGNYCTCDNCKALDDANGSHSGTTISFVNRIAKEVANAGYDNVALDTFAYRYTRKAPSNVVPEKNVIVRICTIECCFSHALDDATCEQNVELMQDLSTWNKICNHIYIWDYTNNYAYTLGIFPDFGVIQKNLQTFTKNGVKGIYEQGNHYASTCNTEFAELRAYLLSRLMQDPFCDLEKEADGFLNAFYGEGGKEIGEAIRLITVNAEKHHAEIYSLMEEYFSFTQKEADAIDALWEKAKADSAENEFALANIKRSEISWRYVKSSLCLSEFSGLFERAKANKALYQDILDHGTTAFSEHNFTEGTNEVNALFQFFPPSYWQHINLYAPCVYYIDIAVAAVVLLIALITLFVAIKRKKYTACAVLPLFGMLIGVAMLSRKTFLAWDSMIKYGLSLAFLIALAAAVAYVFAKIAFAKKKSRTIFTVVATLILTVVYEASLLIINNAIFEGKANDFTLAVAYLFDTVLILIITVCTLAKVLFDSGKKNKEKDTVESK